MVFSLFEQAIGWSGCPVQLAGLSPTRTCLSLNFAAGSPWKMNILPRTALLDESEV
jgi:hypothetical protein